MDGVGNKSIQLRLIFGSAQGRWWWKQQQAYFDPEIVKYGNNLLDELPPPNCGRLTQGYLQSGMQAAEAEESGP